MTVRGIASPDSATVNILCVRSIANASTYWFFSVRSISGQRTKSLLIMLAATCDGGKPGRVFSVGFAGKLCRHQGETALQKCRFKSHEMHCRIASTGSRGSLARIASGSISRVGRASVTKFPLSSIFVTLCSPRSTGRFELPVNSALNAEFWRVDRADLWI
jgi:hypothetical protein